MHEEPRPIEIADRRYLVQRVVDPDSLDGHIDLSEPGTNRPLARISYCHATQAMEFLTGHGAVPVEAVQWMLERAETALRD